MSNESSNPKVWRLSGFDAALVRYEGDRAEWYEGQEDHVVLASDFDRLTARVAELESELTDIRKGVLYHTSPLAERDRLRAALIMLYDKWEDGDPCSTEDGLSLGNAFRLTQVEEDQVLALIPSQRERADEH